MQKIKFFSDHFAFLKLIGEKIPEPDYFAPWILWSIFAGAGIGGFLFLVIIWIVCYYYTRRKMKLKHSLLMNQSQETAGTTAGSIGPLYDPVKLSNRNSTDSDRMQNSPNTKYQRIPNNEEDGIPVTKSPTKSRQLLNIQEIPEESTDSKISSQSAVATKFRSEITPSPVAGMKKRSIGVQLHSPASWSRKPPSASTATPSVSRASPNLSFAEIEQDFEYDYYEPPLAGSYFNPDAWNAELNIDDILAKSELMQPKSGDESSPNSNSVSVQAGEFFQK